MASHMVAASPPHSTSGQWHSSVLLSRSRRQIRPAIKHPLSSINQEDKDALEDFVPLERQRNRRSQQCDREIIGSSLQNTPCPPSMRGVLFLQNPLP